jgi:hypothetical protein
VTTDVLDVAARLLEGLERRGFDCALGGALALSYWSVPRATLDIDLVVHVDPMAVRGLIDALVELGAELDPARAMTSAMRGDFGARVEGIRVDVFVPPAPFVELAVERRQRVPIGDREVDIADAETMVLLKLMYHRTKDLADLEQLFALRGSSLDLDFLSAQVDDAFPPDDPRRATYARLVDATR